MMAARAAAQQRQPDPSRKFHAARERLFVRRARNGDGYIDNEDMSRRLAGRQKAQERLAELVTQLDEDGDRRVSRAEVVDGPTPLFDRPDTDHNGELSKEEVAAIRAELARAGAAAGRPK